MIRKDWRLSPTVTLPIDPRYVIQLDATGTPYVLGGSSVLIRTTVYVVMERIIEGDAAEDLVHVVLLPPGTNYVALAAKR